VAVEHLHFNPLRERRPWRRERIAPHEDPCIPARLHVPPFELQDADIAGFSSFALCHFFHVDTTMRFGLEASFLSSVYKLNKKLAAAGYNK